MPTAFRQRAAVAVLAASLVLVAVLLLALGSGGGASDKTLTSGAFVTPEAATPAPAQPAVEGVPLGASEAWLAPPPPPLVQSMEPATAPCAALGDSGWAVECGVVDMAGGRRVWLVESRPAAPSTLWKALVLEWSPAKAAWLVNLAFDNEGIAPGRSAPLDLRAITVRAGDLTGDGKAELVFGFRSEGSGAYLAYDIVGEGPGAVPAVVASRSGLSHGQVALGSGALTEYVAAYPAGEPECCPAYFDRGVVRWVAGSFALSPAGPVPAPGPGQLDL